MVGSFKKWVLPFNLSKNIICFGALTDSLTSNPILAGNVLIDPGANFPELIRSLNVTDIKLQSIRHVYLTHLHLDHCACVEELKENIEKTGGQVKIWGPPGAKKIALEADPGLLGRIYYTDSKVSSIPIDEELKPEKEHQMENVDILPLWTPGHTPSHISFIVNDKTDKKIRILVPGDVPGALIDNRTGSDLEQLRNSLIKLLQLDNIYRVHESHGYPVHPLDWQEFVSNYRPEALVESKLVDGPFPGTKVPIQYSN